MPRNKFICGCCGAEIDVEHTRTAPGLPDTWRECPKPIGRGWRFPLARKELADGLTIYMDRDNREYTRDEFIDRFGVDPEKAVVYMASNSRIKDLLSETQ